MEFVFVSNYLTLHQAPLCNELYNILGENFLFVETESMESERVAMGWGNAVRYPYVASINEDGIQNRIDEADVVLIGSAPDRFICRRLREKKIVIRYSERILKSGRWHALSPRAIKNVATQHVAYRKSPVYLLCASAYAAGDYNLFGAYCNKSYQWGYFPETIPYKTEEIISNKSNSILQLLWVGRMLKWKHPELAVLTADYLRSKGYQFCLTMIGEGEQRQYIQHLIQKKNLEKHISILDFMPPERVRRYMEKANIFLFTSDFQEGWGAVLNEAMNSGCAVVASHSIGAAPFLICDKRNGYLFKSGNATDLFKKVESLAIDPVRTLEIGMNAFETITKQWNAEVAARRIIAFSMALVENETIPTYKEGPLCKASFLSNHWYK